MTEDQRIEAERAEHVKAEVAAMNAEGLALSHGGQGTMAAASTSSVTSSSAAASTIASTTTTPSTTRHGLGSFGGGSGGGNFGRAGHHGGGLTVTGVSGNTITATGRGPMRPADIRFKVTPSDHRTPW